MVNVRCTFKRILKATQYKEVLNVYKYLKIISEMRNLGKNTDDDKSVYNIV